MATKRKRTSGSWEFIVRRKGVLPRPISLTFATEEEGDQYCARLESLLTRGIVPPELVDEKPAIACLADVLRSYLQTCPVSTSDKPVLSTLWDKLGHTQLRSIDYPWAESWVRSMKHDEKLAPSTIRHYVGALARCLDWLVRRQDTILVSNPLRLLPKKYATYTDADAAVLSATKPQAIPKDEPRDRRLGETEEAKIRLVLSGTKRDDRERPLSLKWQGALELLFDLALESAMRLREMYTLRLDQIDIDRRTIFLEKTKNGDKRQVPMTSVSIQAIQRYLEQVRSGDRGMEGWSFKNDQLFPWWDGNDTPESFKKATALLSRQFARVFEYAGCEDLVFHDLRHEATSRFFIRTTLSDLQISKITGHKDPRMLSRYANLRGSELSTLLW
ncbi:site-specific integrase [Laribacter hongkongensis]|uniref:site-specific integrase n=1 Tax=Laribacter hongkongensis TaxID=168471 RepID=UPI001EFE15EC|nr:site-specific integrase [Laribacter hongkongensis]MCG9106330.1 site-specific integrase [Laribacter hongkongensis]